MVKQSVLPGWLEYWIVRLNGLTEYEYEYEKGQHPTSALQVFLASFAPLHATNLVRLVLAP